jgi:hypothetical protein
MNKILTMVLFIGALTIGFPLVNGCGKSDKEQTESDKRIMEQEALDTVGNSGVETYYATSDGKYWQNYPGTVTTSGAQMIQVKDTAELNKIKQAMLGETNETVYTCEMHPQFHQNYPGKCPVCKMELIPMNKKSTDTSAHMQGQMKNK